MNLTNDSIYHVLDRSFACINVFFECGKMLCIYNNVGFEICCCYFANLSFGLFCFMNSQDAQMNSSPDLFIFWHTLWHVYPLIYTVIRIVELYFTKINVQADDFQILSSSVVKVPSLNFRWAIKSQKLKYRDLWWFVITNKNKINNKNKGNTNNKHLPLPPKKQSNYEWRFIHLY